MARAPFLGGGVLQLPKGRRLIDLQLPPLLIPEVETREFGDGGDGATGTGRCGENGARAECGRTLKDYPEGALANLLADAVVSAYDIRRSSAGPSSAGRAAVSLLLLLSDGSRGRRDRGGSARRGHLRRGRFGEEGAKGRMLGRAGPAAMYVRSRRVGWRRRGKHTRIRQDGRARVKEMGRQSTEEGEEAGRRSEREGEARARDGRAEFQVQAQLTSARSQRPSDPPLHQLVPLYQPWSVLNAGRTLQLYR